MADDHARNERSEKPRQLFATIRPESKYRNQQPTDKSGNFIPFPVTINFVDSFWPVKGGPGGNYTLFDVDLWVNTSEKLERLPIHNLSDESIPLNRIQKA